MAPTYALTTVDNPYDALEVFRELNRSVQRGQLTAEQMSAAIATIEQTDKRSTSLGLSWILLNMTDFVDAFDQAARRDLFMRHLENPYINRVVEHNRLFGLLAPWDQEAFMRAVVERHPILGAQWIITASLRGIFLPTVLELIFERLKSEKFTAEQARAFTRSFLVGSHTDSEGQFDTWSPFIGARNDDETLVQALRLCATHCPEVFFSTEYDLRLEERFVQHRVGDDDRVTIYDTAARHLTPEALRSVSTDVLEKHGYVMGIPKLVTVPSQTTGKHERAYILECNVAGAPTTFLQEAPHGYLNPRQPVIVYFRNPAVMLRADLQMYVAEFIMPKVSNTAM